MHFPPIAAGYAAALGRLFDAARSRPGLLRTIAGLAPGSDAPGAPRGDIEMCRVIPGAGGLCLGWTIGDAEFVLVDDHGVCHEIADALHWNRHDLFGVFGADYGADCADACFLLALPPHAAEGGKVRLLARTANGLTALCTRAAERAPLDAVGYARWAFELPIPPERMVERFSRLDGAIIQRLLARPHGGAGEEPEIHRVGPVIEAPEVTLVIPLYSRFDFIEHQLLEFADDPFIRERCEILYVIDDPDLATPVFINLDQWWQLHGVPFTAVWGGRNRGFSGASNLGLSLARGRKVLFLNSDVIPTTPGWLERFSARLDAHPAYGVLGARLLFPDGGVQHDGMTFAFNGTYGAWLNQHPGKGLAPPPAVEGAVLPCPAVTGACLLGRREEIAALGGFSEDYLIGDFEDSDLCLKVEAAGRRVGLCPDIALTHLERQSFGLQGSAEFRVRVMLFNAWQHQVRWGESLARHAAATAGGHQP